MDGRAACTAWGWRAALGLLLLAACGRNDTPTREDAVEPMVLGRENVAAVTEQTVEVGPTISGSLEPREQAVIRAEAAGSVERVTVDLGQAVRREELLGRIDPSGLGQSVQAARTNVASAEQALVIAERELERVQRLAAAGALAARDVELEQNRVAAARAQLAVSRAELAQASEQLSGTVVRAPISGLVSEKPVNQGDVVSVGEHLFTVVDPTSMRLEATVPSEHLASLAVGAPVEFSVRGYPGQTFEGRVERIAPAADPASRQIPIIVSIPNPSGKLVANLFAEGRVAAKRKRALTVPTAAVDLEDAERNVTVVRDGKVRVVAVETGLVDEVRDRVEVTSGLAEGELVLLGPARDVSSGTPVRVEGAVQDASGRDGSL